MATDPEGDSHAEQSSTSGGSGETRIRRELTGEGFAAEAPISKDTVFELLTSSRRRAAIEYLHIAGRETTRGELAEQLAAAEQGIELEEVSAQQRKRLYISLYQVHLPRMAEAGVIEYDEDRGTISLADRADLLLPYIHLDPTTDGETGEEESLSGRVRRKLSEGLFRSETE